MIELVIPLVAIVISAIAVQLALTHEQNMETVERSIKSIYDWSDDVE